MTIGADGSFDKGGIGIVRFVFEARIHQMRWHSPPAQSQLYSGGNQSLDFIFCICILSAKRSKMGSSKNRGIKVFRSQQPQMDCCYKHSCSKRQLQGLGIAATLFARVWLAAYFEFSVAHFSISVPCKLLEMFFYPQCNSPSRRIAATNPMGPPGSYGSMDMNKLLARCTTHNWVWILAHSWPTPLVWLMLSWQLQPGWNS